MHLSHMHRVELETMKRMESSSLLDDDDDGGWTDQDMEHVLTISRMISNVTIWPGVDEEFGIEIEDIDSPILAWIVFVWVSSAVLVWHCIRMWATFALAQNGVKMKVPNWNGTQIEIISITENYHRIRWLLLMGWSSSLATCGQWCLGMDMAVAAQLLVVWYCWVWLDDRVREDCGNCIMLLCK